jgi:TetR/AcrR family transcriptional repressor of nem operon
MDGKVGSAAALAFQLVDFPPARGIIGKHNLMACTASPARRSVNYDPGMPTVSTGERLLDAADSLMYRRGYEAVGIAELCEVAGAKKGSFYHFFASKRALAVAMLERAWPRTRERLFVPSFADPDLGVFEAVERYSSMLVANLEAAADEDDLVLGCRFGNFAVELASHDPAVRGCVASVFADMAHIVATALTRGIESGELRSDLDAEAAADEFIALMEGRMVLAKATGDPSHLATLPDTTRRLFGPGPGRSRPAEPDQEHPR